MRQNKAIKENALISKRMYAVLFIFFGIIIALNAYIILYVSHVQKENEDTMKKFDIAVKNDQNTITGRPTTATSFAKISILTRCNQSFGGGYNLFSVYKNLTNTSIASIFANSYNHINVILEWNESSRGFMVFSPLSPNNPFENLNPNKSYFILFSNNNSCAIYNGTEFEDLNITLLQGINSATYPYNFTTNISNYINQFGSSLRYVIKWNVTSQKFIVYSPLALVPQFTTIDKGEGQFILLTSNKNLYYDKSALT